MSVHFLAHIRFHPKKDVTKKGLYTNPISGVHLPPMVALRWRSRSRAPQAPHSASRGAPLSAHPSVHPPSAAPPVDVDQVALPAFALADELPRGRGAVHSHNVHQLLYAEKGSLELSAEGGRFLLPPARAAWIRAKTPHEVRYLSDVSLRTVYFSPRTNLVPEASCVVFAAPLLAREMILHAMSFGPDAATHGPEAAVFFQALAALSAVWAKSPLPLRLPIAQSEPLAKLMDAVLENLAEPPSLADAARLVGMSERTLARRFETEAATSYRAFVRHARMVRATELLATPGARVTEVAILVGFESPGAFTHAFRAFFGESPSTFHRSRTD